VYEVEDFRLIQQRVSGSRSQVDGFTLGTKGKDDNKITVEPPCLAFFHATGDRPFALIAADVAGTADRAR
jgi:hypothetical protein